jgi:hypothetical protein
VPGFLYGGSLARRRALYSVELRNIQNRPTEAALLRLVTEPGDEPRAAPKLNHAIIEKRLSLFDSFAIIAADDSPVVCEIFVASEEVRPVIYHNTSPQRRKFS